MRDTTAQEHAAVNAEERARQEADALLLAHASMAPTRFMDRPPFAPLTSVRYAGPEQSTVVGDLPNDDGLGLRLYMKRTGTFTVGSAGDDQNQCGQRGSRTLQYRVVIEGDCLKLTPQGFIIDNNDIQSYFDQKYGGHVGEFVSCERIAMQAVRDF